MLNVVEKITNHVGSKIATKNGSQMMNDETEDEK